MKLSKKSLEAEVKRIEDVLENQTVAEEEKPFFEKYLADLRKEIDKLASKKEKREANV